ncbi:MAG: hypothetical protein HOV80_19905 [Polyangiaceae bacterium]|nr:hypothetical protein [Polyangiaceae bacterium]
MRSSDADADMACHRDRQRDEAGSPTEDRRHDHAAGHAADGRTGRQAEKDGAPDPEQQHRTAQERSLEAPRDEHANRREAEQRDEDEHRREVELGTWPDGDPDRHDQRHDDDDALQVQDGDAFAPLA